MESKQVSARERISIDEVTASIGDSIATLRKVISHMVAEIDNKDLLIGNLQKELEALKGK